MSLPWGLKIVSLGGIFSIFVLSAVSVAWVSLYWQRIWVQLAPGRLSWRQAQPAAAGYFSSSDSARFGGILPLAVRVSGSSRAQETRGLLRLQCPGYQLAPHDSSWVKTHVTTGNRDRQHVKDSRDIVERYSIFQNTAGAAWWLSAMRLSWPITDADVTVQARYWSKAE